MGAAVTSDAAKEADARSEAEPRVVTTMIHHLHSVKKERMRFSYNGTDVVAEWVRGGAIFPVVRAADLAGWACRLFEGRLTDAAAVCVRDPAADDSVAGIGELRSLDGDTAGAELFELLAARWLVLIRTMPAPPDELGPGPGSLGGQPALGTVGAPAGDGQEGPQSPGLPADAGAEAVVVVVEDAGAGGRREEVQMTLDDAWRAGGGGNGSGVVTWRRGGVAVAVKGLKDAMVSRPEERFKIHLYLVYNRFTIGYTRLIIGLWWRRSYICAHALR
jgi:hypothetical protein